MKVIEVKTKSREELIDITSIVRDYVRASGCKNGICLVYVPHTTAAVTINENADPSVRADILMALKTLIPDDLPYTHAEGNSPAHVKASFVGSSANIIFEGGHLLLGTWQGIYFCEFDGPRSRKVFLRVQGD